MLTVSQVALLVKNLPAQCRRRKGCGFNPWVGKSPWRRKWQPTPVLLPGESHGWGSWQATVTMSPRVGHDWSNLTQYIYSQNPKCTIIDLSPSCEHHVNLGPVLTEVDPTQTWVSHCTVSPEKIKKTREWWASFLGCMELDLSWGTLSLWD